MVHTLKFFLFNVHKYFFLFLWHFHSRSPIDLSRVNPR